MSETLERRRRPRTSNTPDATVLGALAGAVLVASNPLAGAIGGALAGNLAGNEAPVDLETALRLELERLGFEFLQLYRRGPYQIEVLLRRNDKYWTITSTAPQNEDWTQESLEDWLFGDLIDFQLPRKLTHE